MTSRSSLRLSTFGLLGALVLGHAWASDHFDRLEADGAWDVYGLPTEGPAGYVQAQSTDSKATLEFGSYPSEDRNSFHVHITVIGGIGLEQGPAALHLAFDNGHTLVFPGQPFGDSDLRAWVPPNAVAPLTHDLTAAHKVTVTAGATVEVFDLSGTTPAVMRLARYFSDQGVTGLPKPWNIPPAPATLQPAEPLVTSRHQAEARDRALVSPELNVSPACQQVIGAHGFVANAAAICGLTRLDEARADRESRAVCGSEYSAQNERSIRVIGTAAVIPMMNEKGGKAPFCAWLADAWGASLVR